jgi:predicted nucleotidyltransferase
MPLGASSTARAPALGLHAERASLLTLLARVAERLRSAGVDFCVIGAAALAVHGIVRATADLDLLVADSRPLQDDFWGADFSDVPRDARAGEMDDPLGGVVRLGEPFQDRIDLVVAKPSWHRAVIANAEPVDVLGVEVAVATAADLVALKLYAGGPQDAWDVHQLLDAEPSLIAEVEQRVVQLPAEARSLWAKIYSERG